MYMELITILEAAEISEKSIQTIRRMIKQHKIKVKRQKTPQGFNYVIVKDSLMNYIKLTSQTDTQNNTVDESTAETTTQRLPNDYREHRSIGEDFKDEFRSELGQLNTTIQKLIEQNDRDKGNFFQLIKTFQDRVYVLEDQIKMLEGPKQTWWQFWK